jgi:hypothetical protein
VSQDLDPNVVRRLAFIRFLYSQGLEQAKRPQPFAGTALMCFHDAVEMFLLLAAEHLRVNLDRKTTFEGYWDQIASYADIQLPSKPAMRRMNNSRVNFKHHGSIPSPDDLEQFRGDVTTFLTDATGLVFSADFKSVSMIDLVSQQAALTRLREAETQADQGNYVPALAQLSVAFDDLLKDYANRKRMHDGRTAYDFGPSLWDFPFSPEDFMPADRDPDTHKLFFNINSAVEQMRRAIYVLAVGLDYRRYARFAMLVPPMSWTWKLDGKPRLEGEPNPVPGLHLSDDEYQFCKQFVIEAALRLAEMDFDLDLHGIQQEHEQRP